MMNNVLKKRKRNPIRPLTLAVVSILVLNGCTSVSNNPTVDRIDARPITQKNDSVLVDENRGSNTSNASKGKIDSAPLIYKNKLSDEAKQAGIQLPKDSVSLNADKVPMNHFINLALGDVLGLDYVVDQSLNNNSTPITLRINQSIKSERMLGLVEEVLQVNGVALVQDDGLLKVLPANKVDRRAPVLLSDSVGAKLKYGNVAEIIPIYYLSLNDASILVDQLISETRGSNVLLQRHLNALMVVARQDDIDKVHTMLAQLDVPKKVASNMKLIQPRYLGIDDIVTDLTRALKASGVPVYEENGTNGVVLTKMSNNTLLMTASTSSWLKYAEDWVSRIDKPKPVSGNEGVYVYYMRNAKANDAWGVISAIFGRQTTQSDEKAGADIVKEAEKSGSDDNYTLPGNKGLNRSNKKQTSNASVVTDSYRVVVDPKRNAIIFTGQYNDYQRLIQLLEYVDQRPRQVLIQAIVAEVKLEESSRVGVNWDYDAGRTNTTNKLLSVIGEGTSEGGSLNLSLALGQTNFDINALLKESGSKVLATPRILALDQETARINAGDQIQVTTGEIEGEDGNTKFTTQFVNTGVTLEITPSINQNGLVEMEISQEVSTPNISESGTSINTRSLQTMLLADSGQTVYMGGLINSNTTTTENKIPLLGDIPYLGNLFKFQSQGSNRSEVVLLLTPYVINTKEDAVFYTNEFKDLTGWDPMEDVDSIQ